MPRIPKIEEWHARYKTMSTIDMEPHKAFISRTKRVEKQCNQG
jgi:hypothetical protein